MVQINPKPTGQPPSGTSKREGETGPGEALNAAPGQGEELRGDLTTLYSMSNHHLYVGNILAVSISQQHWLYMVPYQTSFLLFSPVITHIGHTIKS